MVAVAQIGSGSTSSPVVCTRRWEAAGRIGRSYGATHPALSVVPVLTVNFRQPSYEFTFNVGIG
jgi:hypothetical protein